MKVLHMIHSDLKFAEGAARFLDHLNAKGQHYILYINTGNSDGMVLDDIKTKQKEIVIRNGNEWDKIANIIRICRKFDYIVFHSLFFYYQIKLALAMNISLLKKVVWIEFGGDLYTSGGLSGILSSLPNRLIANKCYGFVGIFPPDCSKFKRRFPHSKAKIFYAPYMGGKMPEEYSRYTPESKLRRTLETDGTVNILIGNCASKEMGHKEVLSYLERFSDNNINLIIPLSYGNMKYGDEIEREARSIFGEKVTCLRRMISEDDYFEYLKVVDIGIFNVQRQQALGNITRLIFRNVKLFLRENSVMYDFYSQRGVPVCKVSDLRTMSFEEFKRVPVLNDREKFERFISTYYTMDFAVKKWNKIYKGVSL